MKNWFKKRAGEPTTFIGLALLIQAIGVLTKMNEAPVIADAVAQAAEPLSSGDYVGAATIGLGGLLGVLMKEKGQK